ncbi:MAG TPA: hypothetical protein VJA46_09930, partial [Acidimicrobiia bacterium]|nr:hypothetical protein [Acidimicrobiia bacterium]
LATILWYVYTVAAGQRDSLTRTSMTAGLILAGMLTVGFVLQTYDRIVPFAPPSLSNSQVIVTGVAAGAGFVATFLLSLLLAIPRVGGFVLAAIAAATTCTIYSYFFLSGDSGQWIVWGTLGFGVGAAIAVILRPELFTGPADR